ncbi:CPBP family intramembrane metalloprotease [Nakamurella flava]|uniref:CPBP family intramembrane metalloprotease n=2 Tax=Nakamurella flava TaxID=2576308 RepID=A0A4U6Q922_9ACTN|nr:CPBP family intramembrane metalloprotease [Nakamurella flava]
MVVPSQAAAPTAQRPPRRVVSSPWCWGIVGMVVCIALIVAYGFIPGPVWIGALVVIALAVVIYLAIMRGWARRVPIELTGPGAARELVSGMALGAVVLFAGWLLVAALGGYSIEWAGASVVPVVWAALVSAAVPAVVEEMAFRGFALQATERIAGTWAAIIVSAVLFGALHINNPGASIWTSTAIAIEAGLLLGAAYAWRRDLRFVIGVHFAWNTVEGLVGVNVSGTTEDGLWQTTAHGSDLMTGGSFGLEASLPLLLLTLIPTTLMLIAAHRRGNLRGPLRPGADFAA